MVSQIVFQNYLKNKKLKKTGIVFEKTKGKVIIALIAYTKLIHYSLLEDGLPTTVKLDIGDEISYELTQNSTMSQVKICNIQLIRKAEFVLYIQSVKDALKKLPRATRYPIRKIISHSVLRHDLINPDRLIIDFNQVYGYEMKYYTETGSMFEPEVVLVDNKLGI